MKGFIEMLYFHTVGKTYTSVLDKFPVALKTRSIKNHLPAVDQQIYIFISDEFLQTQSFIWMTISQHLFLNV